MYIASWWGTPVGLESEFFKHSLQSQLLSKVTTAKGFAQSVESCVGSAPARVRDSLSWAGVFGQAAGGIESKVVGREEEDVEDSRGKIFQKLSALSVVKFCCFGGRESVV